ncbi:unnamed protein product [Lactuca saligna]|uniref:Uncharacterized protein n=1 Tax=Lactuca saligna TaxID=75948 RepID=A0AA35VCY9_LACSI|nr:unnamed protein product [Lactuca saligna]
MQLTGKRRRSQTSAKEDEEIQGTAIKKRGRKKMVIPQKMKLKENQQKKEVDGRKLKKMVIAEKIKLKRKKACGGLQTNTTMKIAAIEDWKNINWCKYLSDALLHSRTSCKPRNKGVYYAEPFPFLLLLYLHLTDCQNQYVNRKIRPICYWNYGKIKSRQNIEKAQGQLGLVTLVEDIDSIQFKDEEDVEFVNEKRKGKQVEKDIDTEENDDIGAENYCLLVESESKTILECRNRIEKTLEHALQKYPDARELCGWFERFVNFEKVLNKNVVESSRTKEKENENETGEEEATSEREFEKVLNENIVESSRRKENENETDEEEGTREREYNNPIFEDNMPKTPNMEDEQNDFLTNEFQGEFADNLMKKKVAIFKLKWWTENNMNDSGVMLMRHMENFKGQGPNNWNSEIEKDQKQ